MHARAARSLLTSLLLLGLLLAVAGQAASPRVHGMPLLQRYTPDAYQAEAANLAVLATDDGFLYAGNTAGLLQFDGNLWSLLELPRRSGVRAMAAGGDGHLYVGGYDQFGRVHTDAGGQLRYEDLRPAFGLDPAKVAFGNVWNVVRGRDGVWFRTSEQLFLYADDGHHRHWAVDEGLRQIYEVGGVLHARVHGQGLSRFEEGRFVLVEGGERFAEQPLYNLLARGTDLLLAAPEGFLRADADGLHRLPGTAAELFANVEPYSALGLPDGGWLFGTMSGELLHFDAELRLVARHRIGAHTVHELALDREGGVWAATEADLVRLRVPAPWSLFSAADGLAGSIYDSAWHQDRLWVATSQGVFSRGPDGGRFELSHETVLEASALLADASGLLIGDREGVWLRPVDGSAPRRIAALDTVVDLRHSKFDPARVLVFGESELLALQRDGQDWQVVRRWPLAGIGIAELYEASATELWIGDYRGGVIRWLLDPETLAIVERRQFGAAEGLQVAADFGTSMNELDGVLYATSGRRTFRRDGARFVEVDLPPFNRVERPWELGIVETDLGTYAWTSRELLRRTADGRWTPIHLGAEVARGYSHVHVGADGMLRLLTWSGLLQFDPGVPEVEPPTLAVGLRSLQLRHRDGRIERLPLPRSGASIDLPAQAALQLDLRLPSMEAGSEYRFRIDGLIDDWSDWGPASSPAMTLRNPGPGRYLLRIEGRTRSGRYATPLTLTIDAAPRWFQTPLALLGAVLLLALLVGLAANLVARLRYRQFVASNRRLERLVADRTAELEAANRKLAEMATEDSLTGVANRRALEQALLREWERCRELAQPLSVLMVDVDHFKQFNDVHGHLAGDQQLVRVARLLAEHVRPVRELLARFGGEEFALVLPGATLEQAMQRAETIRRAFPGSDAGATVSVGVACLVPGPRQVPDDLLRAADMALYAAKRAGRNRVMAASEGRVGSYS